MINNSIIKVPNNLNDEISLRRFLKTLVTQVDTLSGYRGEVETISNNKIIEVIPSTTYVQTEAEQIVANQILINNKLNELLGLLRNRV